MVALTLSLRLRQRLVLIRRLDCAQAIFSKLIRRARAPQICLGRVLFCFAQEKITGREVSPDLGNGR